MNKLLKYTMIGALAISLGACSSKNYTIKTEKKDNLNTVPAWYMADIDEQDACDLKWFDKSDNDKVCIYGVATAVSPDLQLAIEKAKMYAKSEMADIIMGKMNKQSKQFITELGKTESKTIVSEVESVLVNVIKDTPVRGYEIFAQDVTLTTAGYYRAWIGLRLPLGKYNKMFNYNIEQAVDAYNLKEEASKAFEKVIENDDNNL
jgi:hypothetical protein